jgi:thioredoxin reductase (NADPH)
LRQLTVLSRTYCHLCDELLTALESHPGRHLFEVTVIDIDCEPALEAQFGDKVPVLLEADTEICHYFLDGAALDRHLAQSRR